MSKLTYRIVHPNLAQIKTFVIKHIRKFSSCQDSRKIVMTIIILHLETVLENYTVNTMSSCYTKRCQHCHNLKITLFTAHPYSNIV